MNEALVQALIRLVVTFVVAGIGAIIPLLTILTTAVPSSQVPYVTIVVAALTAILSGVVKLLGGATTPAMGAGRAKLAPGAAAAERPNPFAI
jgi:hypothetical protein